LAATFLAVGLLASALTRSQEVAFIVGALVCALLNLVGDPLLVDKAVELFGEERRALVAAAADLAVGPHYRSLSRGVFELRGLAYFFGVSLAALFWTVLAVERRGRSPREVLVALALSLTALLLWTGVTSDRRLNARFDLTRSRLGSLAPGTRELLNEVDAQLTVRAYLSAESVPESTQPLVRALLDLLQDLQAAGDGRVILDVVDPTTPELQEEAERLGVKRFDLHVQRDDGGADVRRIYAGVVVFNEGRYATIPVALGRANLEYDLDVAIRKAVRPRQWVGIGGVGARSCPEVRAALQQVYSVDLVDVAEVKEIPREISLMVYLAPEPLAEREVYVLDQFVARGGKLILLVETHTRRVWTADPHDASELDRALETWGLRTGGLVLQQPDRNWPLQVDGAQVLVAYPWFVSPNGQGNAASPVASGIGRLVLPYASEVSLGTLPPGVEGNTLLASPPAWVFSGVQSLHPNRRIELQTADRAPRPLAAAVRGTLPSAWRGRPSPPLMPEAGGGDDPLAMPMSESRAGGCVVLVGDTDFVRRQWLAHGDGVTFLLNTVDWCLGGEGLASVRSRGVRLPLEGRETRVLGVRRDLFVWLLNVALLPIVVLSGGLGRLFLNRRRRGLAATSVRQDLAPTEASP
jgi:ABC-2 type transport system permease protein